MIGILKYLTVKQLAESQNHIIMSTSDFSEAQTKAHDQKVRAEAVDECIAKVNETEFYYVTFYDGEKDITDMVQAIIVPRLEQLKENKNG